LAQQFDPATLAYLAQLPPEAHAKAEAYTQGGHWLLLWGAVVAVAAAWLVLRSGWLVRLRDGVEGGKSRPWRVAFVVVAADAVLEALIALPWTAYSDWWREKIYGLTDQALPGWFGEWAMGLAIGAVFTALLASGLYALIRRAPKTWWLWGGGLVGVFFTIMLVLGPVFIEPLFNDYKPAPPGPIRDSIVAMAEANGVPSDKIYIYDGSKQSNRYTANVSGLFGTARIAMSDVMFMKGADLAEVRAVVGHEMGHYKRGHVFLFAGVFSALGLIALFLTDRLFPRVLAWTGAKGVRGLADPAGIPILGIIVAVLGLVGTPLINSVTRFGETDADRFSLEVAREPDGLARALVKTIEYRAATPSRLEEVMFYTHPSVARRIDRAMKWKAGNTVAVTDPELPPY
jgi:STE24 endopeptidase